MLARLTLPFFTKLIAFVLIFTLINYCGKEDSKAPATIDDFEGKWFETESDEFIQFGGTNHTIEFKADSTFRLELERWTDVIVVGDTCLDNRIDYIKGVFLWNDNQLILDGKYTDPDFEIIQPNCKGDSDFFMETIFRFDDVILYLNDNDEGVNRIRLVK